MIKVECQSDILQLANNLSLLYDSVIPDKRTFLTDNCLQLQRSMEEKAKMRSELGRMAVSSPTLTSNIHHCTVIHRGADVIALDSCTRLEETVYRTSNP